MRRILKLYYVQYYLLDAVALSAELAREFKLITDDGNGVLYYL